MTFRTRVAIDAEPSAVWAVLIDVDAWPEFVPTVSAVRRETDAPLAEGSRARVKQPGMPELVWTVTGFTDGREFTWEATSGGVTTTGGHLLHEGPGGGCELELTIEQTGPPAPVVRALFGRRTRRYMEAEARSIKERAEAG